MKRAIGLAALLAIISPTVAAPSHLGVWVDADREYFFGFLKDNELTIKGKIPPEFPCNPCQPRDAETTSVWESKSPACVDSQKKPIGNLVLRYDNVFCCMTAEIVGKKLTLFAYGPTGYDRIGACRNRVLSREITK